jgi:hypothetical protein
MLLRGSCHCGAVRFKLKSATPFPYMHCYCEICRKTQGGGGFAINIMGDAASLVVEGKRNVAIYRAKLTKGSKAASQGRRNFCRKCGSALWLWDPRWANWVYPFASAIDTRLPAPLERQHIFLRSKPGWVKVDAGKRDKRFRTYPREAIIDWHETRGLLT